MTINELYEKYNGISYTEIRKLMDLSHMKSMQH